MACSQQAGPRAYLATVESISGVSFSQEQYHALKLLAADESRVEAFRHLRDEALEAGDSTDSDVIDPKVDEIVRAETSRARASVAEKVSAASALGERLAMDSGSPDEHLEARGEMAERVAGTNVTKGTVAVMNVIATYGANRAARMADNVVNEWRRNLKFKQRLEADAEALRPSNPKLAEGMEKAASMIIKENEMGAVRWIREGDAESEYPGLSEKFNTLRRGPESARKFAMYSYEGNIALDKAASELESEMEAAWERGEKWSRDEARERVSNSLKSFEKKFPEVYDTEPQAEFMTRMGDMARKLGWMDSGELYDFF